MIYNIDTERQTIFVGNETRAVEINCADNTATFYAMDVPYRERVVEQRVIDHPQWQPTGPIGLAVQFHRRAQGVCVFLEWLEGARCS